MPAALLLSFADHFLIVFMNSIRMSNGLDPDQDRHFGLDLGQNFLH